jgi:hypothetical protein
MWNIIKKRIHKIKVIEFMLKIQRKLTNSSQDSTSRISRK